MKDTIYTLINEIDNQSDTYDHFEAELADVQKWKKSILKPNQKSRSGWMKYTAAAACACLLLAAAGPARGTVYAQVNAIIYSLSELLGISKDLSPYSTVIGESISKNGITVTLSDVILDDETLLVSYTTSTSESLDNAETEAAYLGFPTVLINGQRASVAAGGSSEKIDDYTMVSCLSIELADIDTSKQMDISIQFNINNTNIGNFAFTASGEELLANTSTVVLDRTFTLPDGSQLTLTRYTASDVNQKLYFESTLKEYTYDLMVKGCDDLGNDVQFSVRFFDSGEGRMEVDTLYNGYIDENAKELTLTLYAAEMPEGDGRMSNDYEPVGDAFTISLDTAA